MKKKNILIASAITAGAVAGASYVLFNEVMNRNGKIFKIAADKISEKEDMLKANISPDDERLTWFGSQDFKEYNITNARGFNLKGYLIPAENESDVYVFCSHGYRSQGKSEYSLISKFYHDLGYNVFIVDHQSHGNSEGKYIGFGYYEYQDCLLWLDYIKQLFGEDIQIILHGISMGSATVMLMNGDPTLPDNVKFTVADCGYTSVWSEFEHDLELMHLPKFPLLYGANICNKLFNEYDFNDVSPIDAISRANKPILFIHGDTDDFVPTYMVHQLYAAYNGEYKDLVLIKGAGHAESYKIDSETYENKVKEFCDKFIK